ncbi:hypothetical protein BLNAU_9544 [Blattamonas nauphoetae]|uniref:Uncharacterized protein n=1 Tax=Blattamonas nauphoetae TaxID=2049346 RepID=A0ABQ9XVK3_9EUKA|nr:hypothetical protein BLNAU_9544 [Blattamonas nauphoetae]
MDVDPHQPITPLSRRREKRKDEMKSDTICRPIDASLPPKTFRQNRCRSENSQGPFAVVETSQLDLMESKDRAIAEQKQRIFPVDWQNACSKYHSSSRAGVVDGG